MHNFRLNHIAFVISIIFMMIFGVSCGGKVTKCSQLDGTYWKSCSSTDSSYVPHAIRFDGDKIYSAQTGNAMTFVCSEKVGKVGNIASFKIVDEGRMSIAVMTRQIPFAQISEDEYESLTEKQKK